MCAGTRGAQATPNGQLVFFAEFLATAGIFDRWVEDCPLAFTSPNAPTKRDVLGMRRALARMDEKQSRK